MSGQLQKFAQFLSVLLLKHLLNTCIHVCTSAASQSVPPSEMKINQIVDLGFIDKINNLVPPSIVSFFKKCVAQFYLS